ncbi:zinc ribbon domain-containing protein [Halegenticoccus tardaugens]|uniref:zinc ribbon domain-containing protein n=1 Tax=Halegenticoccus tardaugens TaxID=2071624 RepID=UPI00100A397B|nr:zinc ribbon domain-containing protein [Halegenticoccus tardaugens]
MGRNRPWLAAALALLVAGAGHVYLRRWRRAALWFLVIIGTAMAITTAVADPTTIEGAEDLPVEAMVATVVAFFLSALDAYTIARDGAPRGDAGSSDGESCPHCGREVDPDLDFCQWCTARLDRAPSEEEPRAAE